MASTRAAKVQKFNQLSRRSKVSLFTDEHSKKLMGVCHATLDYFKLEGDISGIEMPDT